MGEDRVGFGGSRAEEQNQQRRRACGDSRAASRLDGGFGHGRRSYSGHVNAFESVRVSPFSALRNSGTIGDDAFHIVEKELDWLRRAGLRGTVIAMRSFIKVPVTK